MNYYIIPPAPHLSAYVRFFWVLEGEASIYEPYVHRSMADGCCEFIFHYKGRFHDLHEDRPSNPSVISGINGPAQRHSRYEIKEDFGIFGAYLYPFAINALLDIPVSSIANQQPGLESLLGERGKNFEERMMLAKNNNARVNILSGFLESGLTKQLSHPPVFAAISQIIKTRGTVSIDAIATQSFLSTRQFERNFKEYAGFSPKLYSRIIRFQSAMNEYGNQFKSLTEIAYQCGYYDQSHFIHDFKEFSGYQPKSYFSGKSEGSAWRYV